MITHHTKTKGDFGVLKCQVSLAEQGYTILNPATEHAPFDLVAYKDGVFKRIQVKYRTMKNGILQVRMATFWSDRNGTHTQPIDKNEVDLFCIYCPNTDRCYYFSPKDCKSNFTLRIEEPKNKVEGIHYANDYLLIP